MIKETIKRINLKTAVGGLLGILLAVSVLTVAIVQVYRGYRFYTKPLTITGLAENEIKIHGPIGRELYLNKHAVRDMVRDGVKTIYIDIDSPGGELIPTEQFISTMADAQREGVTFVCVVTGMAASAATIILSYCDERYALFDTVILWHSLIAGGMMRLNQASTTSLLDFIIVKNEEIWSRTRNHFWPWYFTKHFFLESFLSASEVEANGFGFVDVIYKYKHSDI